MRRLALIAALAFGAGCGAPDDSPPPLVLSPNADALEVVQGWATRWTAATGRPIIVAEGGTPVRLVNAVWASLSEAFDHDPGDGAHQMCGATKIWTDRRVEVILVDSTSGPGCVTPWQVTIGHEIGHALGGPDLMHSDEGLMSAGPLLPGVTHVIDEPSLEAVCSTSHCATFAPEPAPMEDR